MAIGNIRVTNFKSFRELNVDLGRFNVFIGANASGKSNFVQIFQFLRDIIDFGLDNAISMQGGIEYLRNFKVGGSEVFSMTIISDQRIKYEKQKKKTKIKVKIDETAYHFAIKFVKSPPGFQVVEDRITQKLTFVTSEKQDGKKNEKGTGTVAVSHLGPRIDIDIKGVPLEKSDILPIVLEKGVLAWAKRQLVAPAAAALLIESPFLFWPFAQLLDPCLRDIFIYDFDPRLPKKGTPITGKIQLEKNGENLSIVLRNIIRDTKKRKKLINLVKDVLPFVDDLDVATFEDKTLLFNIREVYSKERYVPASFISDGTVGITALILAIYFGHSPLIIIEEPGRNMHPYLISKIVDMMKDASRKRQIITTTHNPEMVRWGGQQNLFLVSRDKEGFSTVSKPADREEVKKFLQNEIGIEELYVQNLIKP